MLKSTEKKRKDLLCCLCLDVDIVGTTHFEIYKFISLLHHPPPQILEVYSNTCQFLKSIFPSL